MKRTFHLGALLSVTTEHLVCEIADVHALLDFMTGDNLFTHQLPRACDESKPALLRQFPFLAEVEFPEGVRGEGLVREWLKEQAAAHGAWFEVEPLNASDHTHINALTELGMMAPHLEVIPIVVEDGES